MRSRLPSRRRVEARIERGVRTCTETRYHISSATLSAERAGQAVRGHWAMENRLHSVLDVAFDDDQSRLRKGYGARNMAVVRHFALNLARAAKSCQIHQASTQNGRLEPSLSQPHP